MTLGFLNIDSMAIVLILLVFLLFFVSLIITIIALVKKWKKMGIISGILFVVCTLILLFLFGGLIF